MTLGATSLNAFAGLDGGTAQAMGLNLTGAEIALALVTDKADATHTWSSLKATASSAALTGVTDLTLSSSNLVVSVNQAGQTLDPVLDTLTSPISVSTSASTHLSLSEDGAQGRLLRAAGTFDVQAFGFLSLSGSLAMEKSSQSVVLSGNTTPTAVDVLRVGGTQLDAFVGVNASNPGKTGLNLTGVEFGLALIAETGVATPREWVSLQATANSAAFVGVAGLGLTASNISVQINRASSDNKVVDYSAGKTTLSVATGVSTSLALSMDGSRGALLQASAHLNVDVFGFVQLDGDFALSKQTNTLKLGNGNSVTVDELTLGAHGIQAFAGVNGGTAQAVGLDMSGVDLALVLASEHVASGTAREWTSLKASAASVSLTGVDGLQATGRDLLVEVNQAASDGQLIDYNAQNLVVATGPASQETFSMAGADGNLLRASGNLNLSAFGFFQAQGNLAITRKTASLHTRVGSTAATVSTDLLTIGGTGLQAFAGINAGTADAAGLSLSDASFALVLASEHGVATPREWSSFKASAGQVAVVGIDGLTVAGSGLSVLINRAASDATVLDFAGANALTVTTGTGSTTDIDVAGSLGVLTRASGTLDINLLGFAQFHGDVAFEKSQGSVWVQGDASATTANLLKIGASNASGFIGMHGGTAEAVGLGFTGASFGAVVAADQSNTAREWIAMQASISSASFTGVDGLTASAQNIELQINQADTVAASRKVLDWSPHSMDVATGASSTLTLNMDGASGPFLRAAATLDVNVFNFFELQGSFAFESKQQDLTLSDGEVIHADTLSVGGSGVNAFLGTNGGSASQLGFSLQGVDFGLLLATDRADISHQFTTLQASANLAAFTGISDLTLQGSHLGIEVNRGVHVAGKPSSSDIQNAIYHLDLTGQAAGGLRFTLGAGTAQVTLTGQETNAQVITALTSGLESLSTVGAGNVRVSGDRIQGYDIEFVGSLSGSAVTGLAVTAPVPAVSVAVTTDTSAVAAVNEVKDIVILADRVLSAPLDVSVTQVVAAGAGSNEVKALLFTTPYTSKGNYDLSLSGTPGTVATVRFVQNDVTNNAANIKAGMATLLGVPANTSAITVAFDSGYTGGGHRYTISFSGSLAKTDIADLVVSESMTGDVLPLNRTQGAAATNEVQRLVLDTTSSGTFKLSLKQGATTYTTSDLALGASAADVASALNTALGAVGTVSVTTDGAHAYRVSFGGSLAGVDVAMLQAQVTLAPLAPSGSFTIGYNGQNTGNIAYSATQATQAANIKAALVSAFSWSANDIAVVYDNTRSTASASHFTLSFSGALAGVDVANLSTNSSGLTLATATPYNLTQGHAAVAEVQSIAFTTNAQDGSFALTHQGQTTASLALTSSQAQVQAAVTAAWGSNVTVTFWNGQTLLLQFGGNLAGLDVAAVTVVAQATPLGATLQATQVGHTEQVAAQQASTLVVDYSAHAVSVPSGPAGATFALSLDGAKGELTHASGALTLDAFGFVQAQGTFDIEKRDAELTLGDKKAVQMDLLTLGAHVTQAFAGVGGGTASAMGLNITQADVGLVLATEKPDVDHPGATPRHWSSLSAQVGAASFSGVSGLTVSVDTLAVTINRAATDGSLIDYLAQGLEVQTGTRVAPASVTLSMDAALGELTRATGHLNVDVFGALQVAGDFGLEKRRGTVTLADVASTQADESASPVNVDLLLLGGHGLSGFAGINGGQANALGLAVEGVDIGLAFVSERQVNGSPVTPRAWTSAQASITSASFVGVEGLSIAADGLQLQVNRAAADTSVVDYRTGKTDLSILTGPASNLALSLDGSKGQLLQVAGHLTLDVFGFVQVDGDFALQQASTPIDLKLSDGTTRSARALLIGGSNLHAFAGLNGGQSNQVGLQLTGVDFGLALLSDTADQSRSWTSLQATAQAAAFTGVTGLTVSADTLSIEVNQATKLSDAVVDYALSDPQNQASPRKTALQVATGTASTLTLTLDGAQGELMRASGHLQIDAFGFFQVAGGFAIERRQEEFFLNDGNFSDDAAKAKAPTKIKANLLTIGGHGVDAFAGIQGGTTHAIGLSMQGVDFGLALISEVPVGNAPARQFTSLKAQAQSVALVGLSGFDAQASDLSVEINRGVAGVGGAADVVIDHSFRSLDVLTGPGSTVTLDTNGSLGNLTRASGHVQLTVYDFITLSGSMAFESSSQTVTLANNTTVATDALLVGGTGISAFVGINGASADRIGLQLNDASFGLALLSAKADPSRTWTSLQASASSLSFVGLSGLTASATGLNVSINQAGKLNDSVVDYASGKTSLSIPTGTSTSLALNMLGSEGEILKAAGSLDIDLFGFFTVKGSFALEQRAQAVTLSDGSVIEHANLITVGGHGVDAFAGVNAGSADAKGLSLGSVDVGLALIGDPDDTARHFTSLQATAGSASVVGFDGLTLQVQDLLVNVNRGIKVAAQGATTVKVNTKLALKVPTDFVGDLTFGDGSGNQVVQVGADTTELEMITLLSAAIGRLASVGSANNVKITGNREDGYEIEFVGAKSGVNVTGLTVTAAAASVTAQVTTLQSAQAGTSEIKLLTVQALRDAPPPVTVAVQTVVPALAGVNESNSIVFTSPGVAGSYTVYLVNDGLVQQQTAAVMGASEVQRLNLVGDTTATTSTITSPVSELQAGSVGQSASLAVVFKADKVIQEYQIFRLSDPATKVRAVYRNSNNVAQTLSEMRTAYATLFKDLTGGVVDTSAVTVTRDTSYSGTGDRYVVTFVGALAGRAMPDTGFNFYLGSANTSTTGYSYTTLKSGGVSQPEIQKVSLSGGSGSFTLSLSYNGQTYTTTGIELGANAATVRYALNAALSSTGGTVDVSSSASSNYLVTFRGALEGKNLSMLTVHSTAAALAPTGTFNLSFDGQTTADISYTTNGTLLAQRVQTALAALSNVGAANIQVGFNAAQSNTGLMGLDIRFVGALSQSDVADISVDDSGLTHASATTQVATPGVAAVSQVQRVVLGSDALNQGFTLTLSYAGMPLRQKFKPRSTAPVQAFLAPSSRCNVPAPPPARCWSRPGAACKARTWACSSCKPRALRPWAAPPAAPLWWATPPPTSPTSKRPTPPCSKA